MADAKPAVHVCLLKTISVPEVLIKGNKFIKWDESSTLGVPVTLKIDVNGYILYWRDQNKDMESLDISIIRDTRTGKLAKVPKEGKLRDSCTIGPTDIPLEDKTVTIVYGTDMVDIAFLNFVCASREVASLLCDELLKYANNLLALNGSCLTFLEKAYTKLTHVLDQNGKIPVKNIVKMICKDNKEDKRRIEKAIEATGFKAASKTDTIDPNKFTFEDFFTFYRHLVGRTEVDKVFDEIGAKKKPYLTSDQFVKFLNSEQRDPRLNEILYPYFNPKQATELIKQYETKPNMMSKGNFSQEGFLKFLMSEDNNLIPAEYLDLNQDMNQPLGHYFINSSHNTYLTGHQLTGRSSVEIYHQVLLSGCRCIELDCWDGKGADEEPIITHGFTMCGEISFKEVIEAIAVSAFKTSEYPVILSFENHCSEKQQAKMAAHCRAIFGDLLLTETLEDFPLEPNTVLPSPEMMRFKIIVKNKKKHFHKNKQKVTSPKPSNSRKIRSNNSFEAENGPGEEKKEEGDEKPDNDNDDDMDGESDSSESDDDEVSGLTEEEEKARQREKREKNLSDDEDDELDPEMYLMLKAEKGTAGSEAEAGMEMSELVNYVQPVHFHSFDVSEKKNRGYEISSFVETQATNLLKEYPVDFVNYNKRQLSRLYPRGTRVDSSNFMPQSYNKRQLSRLYPKAIRVDSSNFMPQIFWNAGCQLVALNFQTLDLPMQLNLGIFEYNKKTGYILKPDFMRRHDKHFDPFAESTVDGIIAGTVSVKVISGQFLTDKRVGTYIEVDMFGLPTDTHRRKHRTKTVPNNGINPVYDEAPFVFKKVVLPNLAVLRIGVYEEQGKLIGHRVLAVEALRPGYRHINLRNECNQPLLLPTLFVHISVKDYVPDMHADFVDSLSNPMKYLSKVEGRNMQLEVLENDFYDDEPEVEVSNGSSETRAQQSPARPLLNKRSNGSLPNVFNATEPLLKRTPSNPAHTALQKKDSVISSNSMQSDNSGSMKLRTRLSGGMGVVSRMPSNENVMPIFSVATNTRLNEPSIVEPTPLGDLKREKNYLKMLGKRDKDIDLIKKKHEKGRENMKEIHELQVEKLVTTQVKEKTALEKAHTKAQKKASKSGSHEIVQRQNTEDLTRKLRDQDGSMDLPEEVDLQLQALQKSHAEVFVAMCTDQFQAECDLFMRHIPPIYDTLRQVMDRNHKEHEARLKAIHDQEVNDLSKKTATKTKEELRNLQKKHKDKQAFERLKREIQKKHIDTVVSERQKLQEILDTRLEDLRKKFDTVREDLTKDKLHNEKQQSDQFTEKCGRLREQFQDLLQLNITSSSSSKTSTTTHPPTSTANGNGNHGDDHIIKTQL